MKSLILSTLLHTLRNRLGRAALLGLSITSLGAETASAGTATYHAFSNSNTVRRINGDGEASLGFPLPALGSFTQVSGIAIDPDAKKLYYTRVNFIGSVNLDGTGNTIIKDFGYNSAPRHIEIDVDNGRLYFYFSGHTQGMPRGTYRMDTDGTDFEPVITKGKLAAMIPAVDPFVKADGDDGIVIDPVNNVLYWSQSRRLYRSSLSGAEPKVVMLFPYSIASFDIDHVGRKIYYSSSTRIDRSNLDGMFAETVFAPGYGYPEAVELDLDRGRVYFQHADRVKYTNLDGSLAPVEVMAISGRCKDIEVGPMPKLTNPKIVKLEKFSGSQSGRPHIRIEHTTDPGIQYTVQSSPDMQAGNWTNIGLTKIGTGALMKNEYRIDAKRMFYRVVREDPDK